MYRLIQATCLRTLLLLMSSVLFALPIPGSEQPTVRVEPTNSVGPRMLEQQTESAVVRDYLLAWQTMGKAFEENRADLLAAYFVGVARGKLVDTVEEQKKVGMSTRYRDLSHDLKLVFYSPEGLSVQLVDRVEYEVQVLDHGDVKATQRIRCRYVAVLTPTEVRWEVRLFQAEPE
ncbi:MAG TPA: hypothetical protein VEF05_14585 [Terriglobales bacterium]|nr:hypothetical protein [Terriglobales bacterium]